MLYDLHFLQKYDEESMKLNYFENHFLFGSGIALYILVP